MTDAGPLPTLPPRLPTGHKGTFGTVAVVGGSAGTPRMLGGPALSALGALRAGAGLVRLVMPAPVLDAALVVAPSATGVAVPVGPGGETLPHEAARAVDEACAGSACVVIGPGLGRGEGARAASLRAALQQDAPAVIDADALNALAETPELRRDFRAAAVLTPHPGEFVRLARALGLAGADAVRPESRADAADALARTLGCVVVLKGAPTVVSDGHRRWTSDGPGAVNAALATAGSGDVLAGALGALIAQAHRAAVPMGSYTVTSERQGGLSLFDCARLAVAAHCAAGDLWVRERGASAGLLAAELADLLPRALEPFRRAGA